MLAGSGGVAYRAGDSLSLVEDTLSASSTDGLTIDVMWDALEARGIRAADLRQDSAGLVTSLRSSRAPVPATPTGSAEGGWDVTTRAGAIGGAGTQPRHERPASDLLGTGALWLEDELGRGGFAAVYAAREPALGRSVAAKVSLRPGDAAEQAMLEREARIQGLLEHPNLPPIHQLVRRDGAVIVVMKRVDGHTWEDHLRRTTDPALRDGAWPHEQIEHELRTLQQICKAVHFAHRSGILHRDIKPDNVMLGSFGETYLIDWNSALSLPGFDRPGIPRCAEVNEVHGTLGYMPPEVAGVVSQKIMETTDVYLLGATLHRILTGRAPHARAELAASLYASFRSEPISYPAHIPQMLARICQKAMAAAPEERHPSAEAFEAELEAFLQHQHAWMLQRDGEARMAAALEMWQRDGAHSPAVQACYREGRLLLDMALRAWPNQGEILASFGRSCARMAEAALGVSALELARAYLADAPVALPEVQAALAAAEAERAERLRIHRGRAFAWDIDAGSGERGIAAALVGLSAVLSYLVPAVLGAAGLVAISHASFATAQGCQLAWFLCLVWLFRRHAPWNAATRQVSLALVLVPIGHMVTMGVGAHFGLPFPATLVLSVWMVILLWLVIGLGLDARYLPAPVALIVACGLAAWMPTFALFFVAGAYAVSLPLTAWWQRRRGARATGALAG